MKHLLTGVAVVAALAFAAPVWAQNPSGGNALGLPGPNPGGPGLTPYSSGQQQARPTPPAPSPSTTPAAMAPAATPAETSSAMPPSHRHARHVSHGKMAGHHRGRGTQASSSTANQLNQEELTRLQSGSTMAPPPPAPAPMH